MTAYIGLGSNLGDRDANLELARRRLGELGEVLRVSTVLETDPVGVEDQPKFLNQVVALDTRLPAHALLDRCAEIELEAGRVPGPRWGPRVLDLDILMLDGLVFRSPRLELPHPEIMARDFVRRGLGEVAPGLRHPRSNEFIWPIDRGVPQPT